MGSCRRRARGLVVLVCVLLLGACAIFGGPSAPADSRRGVLVDKRSGRTLYTYDRDVSASAKSACNGPCAVRFPPFVAPPDAKPVGKYSILVREDGERQWAYKGKALYFFGEDAKPGDRGGHGVDNLWRIAWR